MSAPARSPAADGGHDRGHSHSHAARARWQPSHDHVYLGHDHRRNERRVWLVIALTATMMVLEIGAGTVFGSMALVADGWHMATHAGAMLITALAYAYARRHATDARYTFGTGKLGDLAGFASAVVLALVALLIAWESLQRLVEPVPIRFAEAMAVAALGLAVNLVSAWLLKDEPHGHGHDHGHDHGHAPAHAGHAVPHDHANAHVTRVDAHPAPAVRDNNLRAAYLHVMADALTSVLAIAALLAGRQYGWVWADPLTGIAGALVITRWSLSLVRDAGRVLLDAPPEAVAIAEEIREALAPTGDTITDLHVWQLGPGRFAAIVALQSAAPRALDDYRRLLGPVHEVAHLTLQVDGPADPVLPGR